MAASDVDDQLPAWSNYGATSVDLAAPGDDIKLLRPDDLYGWSSGTSMAAPDVGGVLALSAALRPNETALQRVDRILSGVEPIPAAEGKVLTGGRLNAHRSLMADLWPVTSVSGVPDRWSTTSVTASFSASDGTGIGVERTEYSLDGSPYQPGAEVTVAADGEHALPYRSVDKAANVEPARSAAVKVDGTAPERSLRRGRVVGRGPSRRPSRDDRRHIRRRHSPVCSSTEAGSSMRPPPRRTSWWPARDLTRSVLVHLTSPATVPE